MGQVAAWLDEDNDDGLSLVRCCLAQLPIIRPLAMAALHVGRHRNAPFHHRGANYQRGRWSCGDGGLGGLGACSRGSPNSSLRIWSGLTLTSCFLRPDCHAWRKGERWRGVGVSLGAGLGVGVSDANETYLALGLSRNRCVSVLCQSWVASC